MWVKNIVMAVCYTYSAGKWENCRKIHLRTHFVNDQEEFDISKWCFKVSAKLSISLRQTETYYPGNSQNTTCRKWSPEEVPRDIWRGKKELLFNKTEVRTHGHPFMQQIFAWRLLCVKHHSNYWKDKNECFISAPKGTKGGAGGVGWRWTEAFMCLQTTATDPMKQTGTVLEEYWGWQNVLFSLG